MNTQNTPPKPESKSKRKRKHLYRRWLYSLPIALLPVGYLLSQPRWAFNLAASISPGALYFVNLPPEAPPTVALTIDDGPSAATPDILAMLSRYDAKATFFNISGHLPGHEAIVTQAVAAGHEIGNHFTADEPSIRLTNDEFKADLLAAEQVWTPYLSDVSSLRWLRPGMGFYNAQMIQTAEQQGYQVVLGNVFPYDTHVHSSRFASAFILRTIQPGDIIVLHDGQNRGPRTVATLEKVLPALKARGYKVTTLTKLSEPVPNQNKPKPLSSTVRSPLIKSR